MMPPKMFTRIALTLGSEVMILKASLNLTSCGTSTNIKEIGWTYTMQFDNVHSCHSKTSTVNHTTNVTIQSNIVQIILESFNFKGVFLCQISLAKNFFLSVLCIVIKSDFGI